jgi:hypothetical protein
VCGLPNAAKDYLLKQVKLVFASHVRKENIIEFNFRTVEDEASSSWNRYRVMYAEK